MLKLDRFVQKTEDAGITLDAAAVAQNGTLLALHRCTYTVRHNVFSVSKSFLSTAVGIAADDGLLTLEDRPFPMFRDLFGKDYDPRWEKVTLRHLLTMTAGNDGPAMMAKERQYLRGETEIQPPADVKGEWLLYAFSRTLAFQPGERFSYSNMSPYIAGRMLERKTGMTVRDFLYERLWMNLHTEYPRWDEDCAGHTFPASDLYLDILDMLKLGLLYLNGGVYEGRRYLSADWVKLAASKQVPSAAVNPTGRGRDEEAGYGFFFWQTHLPGVYMAYGREGQYVIVHPKKNAVICIQAMHHNVQEILNLVWSEIEPFL